MKLLIKNKQIVFPRKVTEEAWSLILQEWTDDDITPLFVRRGNSIRGSRLETSIEREVIITDNTPAHWVFKTCVFDDSVLTKKDIKNLISSNMLPISFMRKRSEKETLIGGMVADKNIGLNESNWKLAHIDRIALKRGQNITHQDYKDHHSRFLSLSNMYLIHKSYSGLAEVPIFNEIVKSYKENNLISNI